MAARRRCVHTRGGRGWPFIGGRARQGQRKLRLEGACAGERTRGRRSRVGCRPADRGAAAHAPIASSCRGTSPRERYGRGRGLVMMRFLSSPDCGLVGARSSREAAVRRLPCGGAARCARRGIASQGTGVPVHFEVPHFDRAKLQFFITTSNSPKSKVVEEIWEKIFCTGQSTFGSTI
jgi:hypothetical protein